MIFGGEHMEWPRTIHVIPCYDEREDYDEAMWEWILWGRDNQMLLRKCSGEDYFYDTAYDKEAEMEMNREYEEAMWGQVLKDGPPKDDDIEWVKAKVYELAFVLGRDHAKMYIDQVAAARNEIWSL